MSDAAMAAAPEVATLRKRHPREVYLDVDVKRCITTAGYRDDEEGTRCAVPKVELELWQPPASATKPDEDRGVMLTVIFTARNTAANGYGAGSLELERESIPMLPDLAVMFQAVVDEAVRRGWIAEFPPLPEEEVGDA